MWTYQPHRRKRSGHMAGPVGQGRECPWSPLDAPFVFGSGEPPREPPFTMHARVSWRGASVNDLGRVYADQNLTRPFSFKVHDYPAMVRGMI